MQKAELFAEHLAWNLQPYPTHRADDYLPKTNYSVKMKLKSVIPTEVENEIFENLSSKKAPVYDRITAEIMEELPRNEFIKLAHFISV